MQYLFYKLWQLFTRIKTNDMPATNAMIFISLCQFFNIALIYILLLQYSVIKMHFCNRSEILYYTIPLGVSVYMFNYFYLYKVRDKLNDKYKNESKNKKLLGNVLLILYVLCSFALVFYFGPNYTTHLARV